MKKYPVITENNSYQVKLYLEHIACGWYKWVCEVQIKEKIFSFYRFKTIYKRRWDKNDFEKIYKNDLVLYAKDTVARYEEENKRKIYLENELEKSKNNWNKWNGYMLNHNYRR